MTEDYRNYNVKLVLLYSANSADCIQIYIIFIFTAKYSRE